MSFVLKLKGKKNTTTITKWNEIYKKATDIQNPFSELEEDLENYSEIKKLTLHRS